MVSVCLGQNVNFHMKQKMYNFKIEGRILKNFFFEGNNSSQEFIEEVMYDKDIEEDCCNIIVPFEECVQKILSKTLSKHNENRIHKRFMGNVNSTKCVLILSVIQAFHFGPQVDIHMCMAVTHLRFKTKFSNN